MPKHLPSLKEVHHVPSYVSYPLYYGPYQVRTFHFFRYPIVRERIIIREYAPRWRPHKHRQFRETLWLLVLKEGAIYAVTDYWLEDDTLYYVERNGDKSSVPFKAVDLPFTKRLNHRLGIPFRLPQP